MAEPPDGCDLVLLRNIPLMTRIARGLARGDGWPGQTAGQGRRLARADGWPGETAGQGRRLARGDGWPGETAGQGRRLARGDGWPGETAGLSGTGTAVPDCRPRWAPRSRSATANRPDAMPCPVP